MSNRTDLIFDWIKKEDFLSFNGNFSFKCKNEPILFVTSKSQLITFKSFRPLSIIIKSTCALCDKLHYFKYEHLGQKGYLLKENELRNEKNKALLQVDAMSSKKTIEYVEAIIEEYWHNIKKPPSTFIGQLYRL